MKHAQKTNLTAAPNTQAVSVTREFDAPRDLVFQMFTAAEHYVQWLGPRELTTTLERFEPWNGGSWRYIQTDPAGNTYAFHGVNHDITAPERIIGTFEFEGLPESGHVALESVYFTDLPGNRTQITVVTVFQSVMDRDGMLASGMEHGVNDSYARLDELLESLTERV